MRSPHFAQVIGGEIICTNVFSRGSKKPRGGAVLKVQFTRRLTA